MAVDNTYEDAEAEGDYIIDKSGEDYLYPNSYFVLVNLPQIVEDSILSIA